jgi:hypothetical protein
MREEAEDVVATAKRVGDGKKETARAAEMVAMGKADSTPPPQTQSNAPRAL